VQACFREALRLYPVAPVTLRQATETTEIGGFAVPKGTSVHINIRGIHYSGDLWPNPAAFQPERFIIEPKLAASRAFLPFGAGPHNCVGYRFAYEEGLIMLVQLYSRFVFRLSESVHPGGDLHLRTRITMAPEQGIVVTAEPRTTVL
jgi:cytochrome P450